MAYGLLLPSFAVSGVVLKECRAFTFIFNFVIEDVI